MRWLLLLIAFPLLSHAAVERLVTLGGDVTEIVYALHVEESLVARDVPLAALAVELGNLGAVFSEQFDAGDVSVRSRLAGHPHFIEALFAQMQGKSRSEGHPEQTQWRQQVDRLTREGQPA